MSRQNNSTNESNNRHHVETTEFDATGQHVKKVPLRLHPCRLCHGNSEILDRRSFRSGATLFFIYCFPKQTVPQRLAMLLLLDLEEKKRRREGSLGVRSGSSHRSW